MLRIPPTKFELGRRLDSGSRFQLYMELEFCTASTTYVNSAVGGNRSKVLYFTNPFRSSPLYLSESLEDSTTVRLRRILAGGGNGTAATKESSLSDNVCQVADGFLSHKLRRGWSLAGSRRKC